jgi:hypothetical protein
MPPKRRSVGAMRDDEEEEEEEEEEKKYEEEEEEEEEEKDDDLDDDEVDDDDVDDYEVDDLDDDDVDDYDVGDDNDDVDDYDVGDDNDDVDDYDVGEKKKEEEKDDLLKKTKRKPATKIGNQRRKIRRFPIRKTCCFAGAEGYSCHKGTSNVRAKYLVPESERSKFPEDARCCRTCYRHFNNSNVTCCFVNAEGYSCRHKGKSNVRATRRVPESERDKFPEDARCCATCYNHIQDAHFFSHGRVCDDCILLGYDASETPGGWNPWKHGNKVFLLCSKCVANKRAERVRRRKGIPKRRKGRVAKGDW